MGLAARLAGALAPGDAGDARVAVGRLERRAVAFGDGEAELAEEFVAVTEGGVEGPPPPSVLEVGEVLVVTPAAGEAHLDGVAVDPPARVVYAEDALDARLAPFGLGDAGRVERG